jgi:hypothetical protein
MSRVKWAICSIQVLYLDYWKARQLKLYSPPYVLNYIAKTSVTCLFCTLQMDSLFIHPEYLRIGQPYLVLYVEHILTHGYLHLVATLLFSGSQIVHLILPPQFADRVGDNELELLNCPFLLFNLMYLGKIPLGAPIFQFHCAGYI